MSRLIEYLETLTVSQGRRAGEALAVLPWQSAVCRRGLRAGPHDGGAESVARGNGKTVLVAGIACAALDGPLAVPSEARRSSSRRAFAQACIAFDHTVAFMGDEVAGPKAISVLANRPAFPDRGQGNRGERAGARFRSQAGARARAEPDPGGRAGAMAEPYRRADAGGASHEHGEATGRAADCARHSPGEP